MSIEPLRGRGAFDIVRRQGRRSRHGDLTLTTLPETRNGGRVLVGFSIGRRVGSAVTRNRLRRRLRAIVRATPLPPGSYLLGAGPGAANASYAELETAVRRLVATP